MIEEQQFGYLDLYAACTKTSTQKFERQGGTIIFANDLYSIGFFFLHESVKVSNCCPSIAHHWEKQKIFCRNT